MNVIRQIARWIIGLLFIFSGFVKALDPVGSQLVFTEYFKAFGLDFLYPFSLTFGIALSTIELLVGIMLLSQARIRLAAWAALLFMVFFTLLTAVLAVWNPVQDCGCFGEFIKLSNWQTFFKNLFFLPLSVIIFAQRKKYKAFAPPAAEYAFCSVFTVLILSLSIYCYRHLPLIDIMGFKAGNNIPLLLQEARENPAYTYESVLIYEKDGIRQEFSIDGLPDTTWTFVNAVTREIPTGVRHVIGDFALSDRNGRYVTDEVLSYPSYTLFLVLSSADRPLSRFDGLDRLYAWSQKHDVAFYALSAASFELSEALLDRASLPVEILGLDYKTALTMVRSNPGLLLLKDGRVLTKWAWRDFPGISEMEDLIGEDPDVIAVRQGIREQLRIEGCLLALVLILAFLPLILRKIFEKRLKAGKAS